MDYDVQADAADLELNNLLQELEHAQQMIDLLLEDAREEVSLAQALEFQQTGR